MKKMLTILVLACLGFMAQAHAADTATPTETLTVTRTPTITRTWTRSPTPTHTPRSTRTVTPVKTATRTNTPLATATVTKTATPTRTVTKTPSPTFTVTPNWTRTITNTRTPNFSPTYTRTPITGGVLVHASVAKVKTDPDTYEMRPLPVDGSAGSVPVGAATSALQTSGNNILASISGSVATESTLGKVSASAATMVNTLASISGSVGTDQTSYNSLTTVAYGDWLTESASTYNLTVTAGSAVPLQVWLTAAQGGAAVRYHVDKLPEAPSWLATRGWYNASTTTVQVGGRWAPGHYLHVISVGSTAVTGLIDLVQ